jgi:hypothetical protein
MNARFASLLFALSLSTVALVQAERLRLANDHIDLAVVVEPAGTNLLALILHDEEHEISHAATNVVLVVPETARTPIPEGFEPLGPLGTDLWILPASQDPERLLLGLSGEALVDLLAPQPVDLFLRRIEGPGHFVAWQAEGEIRVSVSSRDGLAATDKFTPSVGGHEHHNYGFSTNGLFTLWFQARATVGGTNAWSAETPFLFAVEPVPNQPAREALLRASGLGSDGSLNLTLTGTPGATYRVERSANLQTWETVGEVTASAEPVPVPFLPPADPSPAFFRAVTL